MEAIKQKGKVILKIALLTLLSFPLLVLSYLIFGNNTEILFKIPPINVFLHSDISHALSNILLIALLIIPAVNNYGIKSIIIISSMISIIYIPFILFGGGSVIGISGFCFYLISRFLFTRKKYTMPFIILGCFILLMEIIQIKNPDGISHGVHIIGYILGLISINPNVIKFISKEKYNILLPLQ